jgi:hypothetical protein
MTGDPMIRVVVIPTDAPPRVETVTRSLETFQALVGGDVQAVPLVAGYGDGEIWMDENGKYKPESRVNALASRVASIFQGDVVVGPAFVTGFPDARGETTGATDETVDQIETLAASLSWPEEA